VITTGRFSTTTTCPFSQNTWSASTDGKNSNGFDPCQHRHFLTPIQSTPEFIPSSTRRLVSSSPILFARDQSFHTLPDCNDHFSPRKSWILMDRAVTYTTSREKLKNINHCRLYLQAETLLDICTAQGDCLHPIVLDLFAAVPISRPHKYFTVQAKPRPRPWMQFTAFLRTCFCGNARSVKLSYHLGKWFPAHFTRRWNAYYHPVNKQFWIP
jgi:hypothetical protein